MGGYAEVHGAAQTDGSITATEIEVKQNPGAGSYAVFNGATTVSAADYHEGNSSDSIGAAFGNYLASTTKAATTLPLPTDLAGVSVLVDGKPAGLFDVSPTQINYLIPDNTPAGLASVVVLNQGKVAAQGTITVGNAAPSLFTAEQTGQGAPAGFLIRVKSNGQQIRESLSRLDSQNKIVPATIKRSSGDKLFLEVYGTGVRKAPDTDGNDGNKSAESVEATIGGVKVPVLYAGVAPGYAGVDQINLEIPDSALAGAAVKIEMKVKDKAGKVTAVNSVVIAIE